MNVRKLYLSLALAIGLLVLAGMLTLLGALGDGLPAAQAQSGTGVIRVATTGTDAPGCGGEISPCRTVQYAVDQAQLGDEILVATGTYTGVQNIPSLNTDEFTATQVVVITKSVTVRGGYTTADWDTPDPEANPTTLDAQGQGRVVYIIGGISPMMEGLRITGGNTAGLGGDPWGDDAGGGMYVSLATAIISNCVVYSNTASTASSGSGGGLFLSGSNATLSGNTVVSNTASTASYGKGGGLFLSSSDATLSSNTVQGNTASTAGWGYGGGLYLLVSDATLSGNTIVSNTAGTAARGWGGGLYIWYSNATLSGNTVVSNTASTVDQGYGGGLSLSNSDVALSGNTIVSNTATLNSFSIGKGGGLWVWESGPFTLTNNLVADNHAHTAGSGLWLEGTSTNATLGRLLHTTIADNRSSGQGVFVGGYTTLAFTNTIIAGHYSVGITVTAASTATLEATLWYNNGLDTGGGGTILTGTVNVYDDPAFVNPSVWDYHLTAGSAAIDAGMDAGVTMDLDGQARPYGAGYDIGADEWWEWYIYLPVVLKDYGP